MINCDKKKKKRNQAESVEDGRIKHPGIGDVIGLGSYNVYALLDTKIYE